MNSISIDQSLLKAKACSRKGENEKAINICMDILNKFPNNNRVKDQIFLLTQLVIKPHKEKLIYLLNNNRFKEMEFYAQTCFERFPYSYEIKNLLGIAQINQNEFEKAEITLKKAYQLEPKNPYITYNLGNALQHQNKLNEALAIYDKAISLKPNLYEAICSGSEALIKLERSDEAIISIMKAIKLKKDATQAYIILGSAFKNLEFKKPNLELESNIIKLLDKKNLFQPVEITLSMISLLKTDKNLVSVIKAALQSDLSLTLSKIINTFSNNKLFLKFLGVSLIPDLDFEKVLQIIRTSILQNIYTLPNNFKIQNFQSYLAIQCFMNDFIYEELKKEKELLLKLEANIENYLNNGRQPPLSYILCLASYRKLGSYKWSNLVLFPDNFIQTSKILIKNEIEEKIISSEIPILNKVLDSTSLKVKKQYEENPYPTWDCIRLPWKPLTIAEIVNNRKMKLHDNEIKRNSFPEILIAGCGTGQQSINTALLFKNSQVLAIDLSLKSLSFAKRKSQEIGLKNIKYIQADILDLKNLNKSFDVIESVGVLHHMKDPMIGWKILIDLLKTGGLMKIGLYSKLARLDVELTRREINNLKIATNLENLKSFRKVIINSNKSHHVSLKKSYDFYNTSMFRDLIFHSTEHCFTILQIKEALNSLDLKFCGFEDERINKNFEKTYSKFNDRYDLDKWDIYEKKFPQTFEHMYQFWCQKN